jgi:hypothetical protein
MVATLLGTGEIRLWDMVDRGHVRPRATIRAPSDEYRELVFSPNSTVLAAVTSLGSHALDLWYVPATGSPELALRMDVGTGTDPPAFLSDGTLLFLERGGLGTRTTRFDALVSRICATTAGDLTRERWTRYIGDELPWRPICPP